MRKTKWLDILMIILFFISVLLGYVIGLQYGGAI